MEAKTEKKGNIIDAFVGGARNGFKIGTNSMVPNIIFGFAVISILNLTGLMEIIGKVFTPIMGIFGLPGVAATAWMAIFVSMGGAAGVIAGLFTAGQMTSAQVAIMLPALLQPVHRCSSWDVCLEQLNWIRNTILICSRLQL